MASVFRRVRPLQVVSAALALAAPSLVAAQNVGAALGAGAGLDTAGEGAYVAQIAVLDSGESSSVEVALSFVQAGLSETYSRRAPRSSVTHDYMARTHVRGLAVVSNYLFSHSRERRGPYFVLGLGLGALEADWIVESPTNNGLGTPRPGGGSLALEDKVVLGSMVNFGVGHRFHRNADLRAQAFTLLVPATEAREDMKFVPALTLSAGLGF